MMNDLISDESYKALCHLYQHGKFPDDTPYSLIAYLVDLEFAEQYVAGFSGEVLSATAFSSEVPIPAYGYAITELGKAYVDTHERQERRYYFGERRAWITLVIACLGAVLSIISLVFQHAALPGI